MGGGSLGSPVSVEGRANQPELGYGSSYDFVAGRYFRTMGIPLLRGRDFAERDNSTNAPRVCIFNDALQKTVFPDEDPIGKRIRFWGEVWEVVGVVGSVRHNGLNNQPSERIYLPQVFCPWSGSLVVRTKGQPLALAEVIRKEILVLDPEQPVSNVRTLEEMVANSVANRRLTLMLLGIFASVALGLAAMGLYGVMAYAVSQRTHEIGIRIALGAQRKDVLSLIVRHGMGLTLAGLVFGLGGSFVLTRLLANQLYEVGPTDPTALLSVSVMLTAVAFLACYIPAKRAAKVDPMEALRYE
jgi:putative ABC transport system permease protein